MNIPWNLYEAAILLNGYLQIKYAERNRDEVIVEVSEKLRTMAMNNGTKIDDIYRNTNGIYWQMKSMESAYEGYTVIKPSTKIFDEIVKIYKTDVQKYKTIREEANRMINPMGKKDTFELWVKNNTHYTKNDLATFYKYYDSIEVFAHKRKAILGSIFDVDQREINNIEAKVFNNPLFRIGRNVQAYKAAFEVLINFLKDYRSNPTNLTNKIRTNETARSEIKNPQTVERKNEVKQPSSPAHVSSSKEDGLKLPSNPKIADENTNGKTEETAPNAEKTIQEIIDDVNRRAKRNRVFLNFFDDLKNEYPEFEFTNINAKGVERNNKVYIYRKDVPRQGNVLFELKHIKEKNDFVLLIKREYLTEEEFKEAIESSNKSTNARGRLTRHWKNCQEAVGFISPKLKLAAEKKRSIADNKTTKATAKTPVVLGDTILDYFEPISKNYSELVFTNLASTGSLQRTKTFSGSDVYAEIEFFDYGSMNEDYTSEGWEHTVMGNYPVICIPFAGDITNDNFESLRIPANTVFDEQGNGNEELTGTHLYNTKIQPFFKNKNGQYSFARRAVEKSTIRFTYCYWNENVSGTVDFYYDGELVAGKAAYFEIDSIEAGTHTITAKKCGVLLDECSFDVITEWDKAGEDLSDLGGTLLEGIVALPLLIGGVAALPLLAPVLGAILPPLGLAAIAAPILPVALLIDGIISAITWISSSFGN